MKCDPNHSAFAYPGFVDPQGGTLPDGDEFNAGDTGLTKREYFAAQIMTGFAAQYGSLQHAENMEKRIEDLASLAVSWANCLIEALDKKRT